jgi:hypothetical protein
VRRHLTFANVLSVIAVFIALGGGAYAAVKLKANSVGSKQVKPDSLVGQDVNEAALGRVPSAGDAGTLDGVDSSALARRGLTWTLVEEAHQSGSPPGRFTCFHSDGVVCDEYFENFDGAGGRASTAIARDGFGMVHLAGSIRFETHQPGTVNPGTFLHMPPGHRPPDLRVLTVMRNGAVAHRLDVGPDGALTFDGAFADGDWFSLDGISFPCGPPGAAGCP